MGRRRAEIAQRDPGMALGKVRRKKFCHPPPVSIVILFVSSIEFFIFCELNV